jgi:predicted MFS family arabinose efflux permease
VPLPQAPTPTAAPTHAAGAPTHGLSTGMTMLFAVACGLCVANIYFAQPLLEPIALDLHLHAGLAGLVMTLTQLGYGAGLLFLVPLADVIENRRLVTLAISGAVIGLVGAALSTSALTFLLASFVVGICAVAAQVLVPFASHLAPDASRGKMVGNVMAGLLAGIMLARPFSSIVAAAFGWRAVFGVSAVAMTALAVVVSRVLPRRQPSGTASYLRTLRSLPGIVLRTPLLRRRAVYQGLMFACFQAFWTAVPLVLAHQFGLGQAGIAAFALAGAAGAFSAPWAGHLADRGRTRAATGWAMVVVLLSFAIGAVSLRLHWLAGLVVAALLVDGAVQVCQVLSIRSIYMLAPELRGRLNALFMTFVFLCAALASGTAAAIYTFHGWDGLCLLGAALAALALLFYATEFRAKKPPATATG